MRDKNLDLWGQLLAWFAAHKEGGCNVATAALMALLRSAYVGRNGQVRRLIDASMTSSPAILTASPMAPFSGISEQTTLR